MAAFQGQQDFDQSGTVIAYLRFEYRFHSHPPIQDAGIRTATPITTDKAREVLFGAAQYQKR